MEKEVIVIAGPTAVGKTEFAINIAKKLNLEIISADSRQFYKEIPIGTSQPSKEQLNSIKHHFIASHSIFDDINAGKFEDLFEQKANELFEKKSKILLVGGSGLYIKSAIEGFDNYGEISKEFRQELNQTSLENLSEKLLKINPDYHKKIDLNNRHRVIRAIEKSLTNKNNPKRLKNFNIKLIGIDEEREYLYNKINKRVEIMIENGLIEEAQKLYLYRDLNSLKTVGYKEIYEWMDGNYKSLEEVKVKIKQNTRNFAKRQLTWFRNQFDMKWFKGWDIDSALKYIENN